MQPDRVFDAQSRKCGKRMHLGVAGSAVNLVSQTQEMLTQVGTILPRDTDNQSSTGGRDVSNRVQERWEAGVALREDKDFRYA